MCLSIFLKINPFGINWYLMNMIFDMVNVLIELPTIKVGPGKIQKWVTRKVRDWRGSNRKKERVQWVLFSYEIGVYLHFPLKMS